MKCREFFVKSRDYDKKLMVLSRIETDKCSGVLAVLRFTDFIFFPLRSTKCFATNGQKRFFTCGK